MSETDISGFKKLIKDFEKLDAGMDPFLEKFLLEMAQRAWKRIEKRTPVGDYGNLKKSYTKKDAQGNKQEIVITQKEQGGELRKNWKLGAVKKIGNDLQITIYNTTNYATEVEYGHRQAVGRYVPALGKRLKQPWVEGHFMATISMQEIEAQMPARLDKAWNAYCAQTLKGK